MMKLLIIFAFFLIVCHVQGYPVDYSNPKLQVEYISDGAQQGPKPNIVPVTRPPLIIDTPPPVDPNSKTFAYNSATKTWTLVNKSDPQPGEETLLWNQSNDKWLTKTPQSNV